MRLSLKCSANADVREGMKNPTFQVSPKLGARRKRRKKKKVVHSPFSALALQMLMQSVLSWALNRSKISGLEVFAYPPEQGGSQQTGLALHITSSQQELTALEKIECGQRVDCKVKAGARSSLEAQSFHLSSSWGEKHTLREKIHSKCIIQGEELAKRGWKILTDYSKACIF